MGELIHEPKGLLVSGFTLARTHLAAPEDMTFEQWQTVGEWLAYCNGAIQWWIGDWMNAGEGAFGEKASQLIDLLGYDYQTIANAKWVAGKIPPPARRENLPFSFYAEVAALEEDERERTLGEAVENGWTRQELRNRLAGRAGTLAASTTLDRLRSLWAQATAEERETFREEIAAV